MYAAHRQPLPASACQPGDNGDSVEPSDNDDPAETGDNGDSAESSDNGEPVEPAVKGSVHLCCSVLAVAPLC